MTEQSETKKKRFRPTKFFKKVFGASPKTTGQALQQSSTLDTDGTYEPPISSKIALKDASTSVRKNDRYTVTDSVQAEQEPKKPNELTDWEYTWANFGAKEDIPLDEKSDAANESQTHPSPFFVKQTSSGDLEINVETSRQREEPQAVHVDPVAFEVTAESTVEVDFDDEPEDMDTGMRWQVLSDGTLEMQADLDKSDTPVDENKEGREEEEKTVASSVSSFPRARTSSPAPTTSAAPYGMRRITSLSARLRSSKTKKQEHDKTQIIDDLEKQEEIHRSVRMEGPAPLVSDSSFTAFPEIDRSASMEGPAPFVSDGSFSAVPEVDKEENTFPEANQEQQSRTEDSHWEQQSNISTEDSNWEQQSRISTEDSNWEQQSRISTEDSKLEQQSRISTEDSNWEQQSRISTEDSKLEQQSRMSTEDSKLEQQSRISTELVVTDLGTEIFSALFQKPCPEEEDDDDDADTTFDLIDQYYQDMDEEELSDSEEDNEKEDSEEEETYHDAQEQESDPAVGMIQLMKRRVHTILKADDLNKVDTVNSQLDGNHPRRIMGRSPESVEAEQQHGTVTPERERPSRKYASDIDTEVAAITWSPVDSDTIDADDEVGSRSMASSPETVTDRFANLLDETDESYVGNAWDTSIVPVPTYRASGYTSDGTDASLPDDDEANFGSELTEMANELRNKGPAILMEWMDLGPMK